MQDISRRQLLRSSAIAVAANVALPLRAIAASPLNLGFQMTTWGAVGMVAQQLDLFKKNGASVAVNQFDSGTAVRDAMVAGRVDIGVVAVSTFIIGADKGQLDAMAAVAYSGRSNSIMVAKDSNIKTVGDLKGRKVASQIGTGSDYTFKSKVLPAFGLKEADLQIVNVRYADQVSALASGSVEAFVGTEPYPSVAEHDGLARTLIDFEKYDMVPVMLAVNRDVLKNRQDDLVAFMRGWLSAVQIFETDMPRATKIVWEDFESRGYKLPESVIRTALDRLGVDFHYRPELQQYLADQGKELLQEGKIRQMPDWGAVLDRTILQRAQKA